MNRRRFAEPYDNDIISDEATVVVVDVVNNEHDFYVDVPPFKTSNSEFIAYVDSNNTLNSETMPLLTNNITEHSTNNISSQWTDPISFEWRVLWLILSMSIFVTGGVANILTAYVILYTSRGMRRASYVLIAGVAIADVWMCLLAHPSEVVASACAFLWHIELPAWWCPVNETLLEIFSCTSILAQMWVAVNRGIAVFAPYFYRAHMRSVRVSAQLLVFGAVLPSVLFNGPGLFGLVFVHIRNTTLGDCKHISPIAMVMQLHFGLFYAGPTALSIAIYLAIFMKIVITTSPRVRIMAASSLKFCRRFKTVRRARKSPATVNKKQAPLEHYKMQIQQIRQPQEGGAADVSTLSSSSNASSKSGDFADRHANGITLSLNINTGSTVVHSNQQITLTQATTVTLTTTALRRHAQTATAMFVCVLLFAVAIVPPRILLVNDLYWRTPVLGIILKLALRTTFATNPIFYFCFNREFRAAYLRLFGIQADLPHHHHHHHHHQKNNNHTQQNGNSSGGNDSTNLHDNHVGKSQQSTRHNSHTGVVHLLHPNQQHRDFNSNTANLDEHVGILMPLLLQTAALPATSISTGNGSSFCSGIQYVESTVVAAATVTLGRK